MVSDLDIWRTAAVVVKEHGEDASTYAAMRADALMEAGDMEGRAVWLRVLAAVRELLNTEPGCAVH